MGQGRGSILVRARTGPEVGPYTLAVVAGRNHRFHGAVRDANEAACGVHACDAGRIVLAGERRGALLSEVAAERVGVPVAGAGPLLTKTGAVMRPWPSTLPAASPPGR